MIIGTETEYGIYRPGDPYANAVALSTEAVQLYGKYSRGGGPGAPVAWDYRGEDPLNDLRGRRLDRVAADPSQLTDDPYHLAPPGGHERLERPTPEEMMQFRPTSMVLANGARLYVDHAHPEYSSPEVSSARDAVLWDRAGEKIAQRIMNGPTDLVLVKNNVDGKGATYGSHENYLVSRMVDLDDLIRAMIPFLVTRPIFCGAGRVGIGQKSERPGFQISQRADYVENDIGLETTFNRPIFNTRDEPHADGNTWRRIHVIGADANMYDHSIWLRLGTTALVLRAIEAGTTMAWDGLDLHDAVSATWAVSKDLTCKEPLPMKDGTEASPIQIQRKYLTLVDAANLKLSKDEKAIINAWNETLHLLETNPAKLTKRVEWIGKHALLDRQRQRMNTNWDDPRIQAMDVQWADLRPEMGLAYKLASAGLIDRLFTDQELECAADNPPPGTRATIRGNTVKNNPDLTRASWTSLVFDSENEETLIRVPLANPAETKGTHT
jgi:proteasome accessory factor PafA2